MAHLPPAGYNQEMTGRPRKDRAGDTPDLRVCTKCGRGLPMSGFHNDRTRPDGLTVECRDCRNARVRAFEAAHPGRKLASNRAWRAKNPERVRAYLRRSGLKRRRELLDRYGGVCACCGESCFEFLTIDHINGGGTKHRQELKRRGDSFYKWLRQEGYPPGFRVLCHNCNAATGFYGYCPHQRTDQPTPPPR